MTKDINNKNINNKFNKKGFTEYLTRLGKGINTILSYNSDIKQFFNQHNDFTRENIIKFRNGLKLSSTTINRKLSSLKNYNEYLLNNNLIDDIMIYSSDYTRIQDKGNPTNISEKTVLEFLKKVKEKDCTYKTRNIAIIYLMANTAIRREECSNLLLKDVDIENKRMRIIGKGGVERVVMLNDTAVKVIKDYLEERQWSKYEYSEYLFLSERGNKLQKEAINNIYNFYSTKNNKVNPHALRHNWCTTMIENGILSIIEVKNQAGHKNLQTTEIYTHARQDKILEKISNFSIG